MIPGADKSDKFLDLFLRAEPRVYAYIRSQVPHRADAEDVLQETAATLWAKFDTFVVPPSGGSSRLKPELRASPESAFVAWAYQVARFEVQHFHDRQTRRRRLFSRAFVDLVAAKAEEMAGELGELQPMLAECMKRLPEADREVVQRCYGSDETLSVVAAQLGRPLNTVKSVLKRARRALYDCIQRGIGRGDRP